MRRFMWTRCLRRSGVATRVWSRAQFVAGRRNVSSSSVETKDGGKGDSRRREEDEEIREDDRERTHFGFRSVDKEDKEHMVRGVFDSVAESYDVMNDLMSGTMHRLWKDHFVAMLNQHFIVRAEDDTESDVAEFDEDAEPVRILDVAGGTGDIAFRMCDAKAAADERASSRVLYAPLDVTVFDINPSMLDVGQRRSQSRPFVPGISMDWVEGNAESLPFEDESFDVYTIAFGIRNVTNIPAALDEARRVLKPGGRFMCLEFSHVENPMLRAAYTAYSFNVIPEIGNLVAGDRESYQYLVESIARFPNQETFRGMVEDAGFKGTTYVNMTGGVVAIHSGFKL